MNTKIYVFGDDLLIIDTGETMLHQNICAIENEMEVIFSDGTEATVNYHGEWNITVQKKGNLHLGIIPIPLNDMEHTEPEAVGCTKYSDVLIMKPGLEWVISKTKHNL